MPALHTDQYRVLIMEGPAMTNVKGVSLVKVIWEGQYHAIDENQATVFAVEDLNARLTEEEKDEECDVYVHVSKVGEDGTYAISEN